MLENRKIALALVLAALVSGVATPAFAREEEPQSPLIPSECSATDAASGGTQPQFGGRAPSDCSGN